MTTMTNRGISPPANIGFTKTSIGRKLLMAVTGVILIGFVTGHMIGNLQVFLGAEQLNNYAHTLQNLGVGLWAIRGFLIIVLIVHIWTSVRLWLENKAARPVSYARKETVQASIASRTMIYSGAMVFLYLVYHLLHFTVVVADPSLIPLKEKLDVYSMIIVGFRSYWVSGVYIVAMFLLAYHLSHAVSSFFQTLGLNKPSMQPKLKLIANLYAIVITIGYVSIPVAVLLNLIKLPGGGN